IGAALPLSQRHGAIGAPVDRAHQPADEREAAERRAGAIARVDLHGDMAVERARNVGGHAPIPRSLLARRRYLRIKREACPVGVVDLGSGQRIDRKLHHHHVDADDDAEEGQQPDQNRSAGQWLRRNACAHGHAPCTAIYGVMKWSWPAAVSLLMSSCARNTIAVDLSSFASGPTVTSTRVSKVWSGPTAIRGLPTVTVSPPTIWTVAPGRPSTSRVSVRISELLLRTRTV